MKRRHFITLAGAGAFATSSAQSFPQIFEQETNWKPDGQGSLGKIGLLTPDFDPVPESEMWAMAPKGVSIHASRVKFERGNAASYAEAPNIDDAVELLTALSPRVILSGWTSGSYAIGFNGDVQMKERLEKRSSGIPVIPTCQAAVEAFQVLGARKIALIHPPWFSDATNAKGKAYFESRGYEVAFCKPITPYRKFTEVPPSEVYEWIKNNAPTQTDVIFIAGNGLRMAGAISRMEQELDIPILSANQVLLWAGLRLIGVNSKVNEYGKIFAKG